MLRRFLERELERGEEGRQEGKAHDVEPSRRRPVGRLALQHEGGDAAGQDARANVDEEEPVPGIGLADFGNMGARWLHTGGIFAALSDTTPLLVIEAVKKARQHGVVVSYDLNYRPSLWKSIGGKKRAQEVNREIAQYVDVMIGNEEDFTASLGFEVEGAGENLLHLDPAAFKKMIDKAVKTFPNFKVVATTLRAAKTATRNDWAAVCWAAGQFHESRKYPDLEILDRVGGGDSFASGLIYGLMTTGDAQAAVDYGAAHGALAMTTPGDTSMAARSEVEALIKGAPRVQR